MTTYIPAPALEQLLVVQHAKGKQPELDLGQAVRAVMTGASPEEMISVGSRLLALQNMLQANPSLKAGTVEAGNVAVVKDAVLKAAAVCT